MQSIRKSDVVDIFGIVFEMRKERVWMVQTEQQYICIHQVGFGLHLHPSGWVWFTSASSRLGLVYICIHQVGFGLHLHPSGWVWFTSASIRLGLVYICIHEVGFVLHLHPSGWVWLTSTYLQSIYTITSESIWLGYFTAASTWLGWVYLVALGLHLHPSTWLGWFYIWIHLVGLGLHPVLRIRDVYRGSWILIFIHPGSRIQKQQQKRGVKKNLLSTFYVATNFTKLRKLLGQSSKNYRTFYSKNCH